MVAVLSIGLCLGSMGAVVVFGQEQVMDTGIVCVDFGATAPIQKDKVVEFFAMDNYALVEYTVHSDNAVTIVLQKQGTETAQEDIVGDFFSCMNMQMVEFSPNGGRNGEMLIVVNPISGLVL